jgi:DNA-directed RNA polymerase specialized sigma24 family protein
VGDTSERSGPPDCPDLTELLRTHYRMLVRLAALLTGDAALAEAVAADSCWAARGPTRLWPDGAAELRCLQREVVMRSRRARRPQGMPGRHRPAAAPAPDAVGPPPDAADFASLPVVRALRDLPARAREALVLTYYLDLPEQQAAAVAGVSLAALRRSLAVAFRALPADLLGR